MRHLKLHCLVWYKFCVYCSSSNVKAQTDWSGKHQHHATTQAWWLGMAFIATFTQLKMPLILHENTIWLLETFLVTCVCHSRILVGMGYVSCVNHNSTVSWFWLLNEYIHIIWFIPNVHTQKEWRVVGEGGVQGSSENHPTDLIS